MNFLSIMFSCNKGTYGFNEKSSSYFPALLPTFGGMCSWRRVAVARVFALVVRCRIKRLLLYSCVGKNRDTRRESPAGAGAGRTAGH